MSTALVTGASRGLGRALATALADRGWTLVIDARDATDLHAVADDLSRRTTVVAVPGDVTHPAHRTALAAAVAEVGPLDLLVNNAGALGPSPLPRVLATTPGDLRDVLEANVVAPVALLGAVRDHLGPAATVVNVTSDAAVEAYEGWGAYGASKAALDHLSAVLGVERPDLRVLAVDPGDLRTDMHQAAFPGEDISDRPRPEEVVDDLLRLVAVAPASGRWRVADLPALAAAERQEVGA